MRYAIAIILSHTKNMSVKVFRILTLLYVSIGFYTFLLPRTFAENDLVANKDTFGTVITVETLAELTSISADKLSEGQGCLVYGYYKPNDGGGGVFRWSTKSAEIPREGIIYLSHSGNGRWIREFDGPVNVRWFGANESLSNNANPFQMAIDYAATVSGTVEINGGIFIFTDNLILPANVTLMGATNPTLLRKGTFSKNNVFISLVSSRPKIDTLATRTVVRGLTIAGYECCGQERNMWTANSTAIEVKTCRIKINECHVYGFDRAITSGDNAYIIAISGCSIDQNNYGIYFDASTSVNSGEKLSVSDSLIAGNETGAWSKWVELSFFDCSFDFNFSLCVVSTNTNSGAINGRSYFVGCHFENTDANSGNGYQFDLSAGRMIFEGCTFVQDKNHLYFKGGTRSMLSINNCQLALPDGGYLYDGNRIQSLMGNVPRSDHMGVVNKINARSSCIPNGSFELRSLAGWRKIFGNAADITVQKIVASKGANVVRIAGGKAGTAVESIPIPVGYFGKVTLSAIVLDKKTLIVDWIKLDCRDSFGDLIGSTGVAIDYIVNSPKTISVACEIPMGTSYLTVEIRKGAEKGHYLALTGFYLQFD